MGEINEDLQVDEVTIETSKHLEKVNKVNADIIHKFENGEFDILVNFCDCLGQFTDGFNKEVLKNFPAIKLADEEFGKSYGEDPIKGPNGRSIKRLGSYLPVEVERSCGTKGTVVTAYIKFFNDKVSIKQRGLKELNNQSPVQYPALYRVMTNIAKNFAGKSIGIPTIRGVNKKFAKLVIDAVFKDTDCTIIYLNFDTDPQFNNRRKNFKKSSKTEESGESSVSMKDMVSQLNDKLSMSANA